MKHYKIFSFVLVFTLGLTFFFSSSFVNANTIYTNYTDNYTSRVYAYNSISGTSTSLLNKRMSLNHGTSNTSTGYPQYSYSPYFTKYDYHSIGTSSSTVIVPRDRLCVLTIGNIYNFYSATFYDEGATGQLGQVVYDGEIEFYPTSIEYKLYYTDSTISSSISVPISNYTQNDSNVNNPYSLCFGFTPSKDVWKVYVTISFKCINEDSLVSKFNTTYFTNGKTDCYWDMYSVSGSNNPVISLDVEDRSTTLLDSINNFISNIKTNVSNTFNQLSTGFSNVSSWLSNVKSGIVDKLGDVKEGIVSGVSSVGTKIVSMKDNVVSALSNVKDGIVDKLKSVSDFFSFSKSGQSVLDGFNSESNDSSSKLDNATNEFSNSLSSTSNLDDIMDNVPSNGVSTYSSDSNFTSVFAYIINRPIVSSLMLLTSSACILGYVFFGKR